MHNAHFKFKWFIRGIFLAIVFVAFFSLILMLLWNWLMPVIFGLTKLTYLQAAGLLILSKIIFSGHTRKGGEHFRDKKEFFRKKFAEHFKKDAAEDGAVGTEG